MHRLSRPYPLFQDAGGRGLYPFQRVALVFCSPVSCELTGGRKASFGAHSRDQYPLLELILKRKRVVTDQESR
jgi:hypothetical protein